MSAARVLAFGAISALGRGADAFAVGRPGDAARCAIARDEVLAAAGLRKPQVARAVLPEGQAHGARHAADRATQVLEDALHQCAAQLDAERPGWRKARVGLAIGTSSGGMLSAERFFAARAAGEALGPSLARAATYFAPFIDACAPLGVDFMPVTQILGACASSTLAVGVGARWLLLDRCDLVLAGGYDAVSVFVAAGFEALGATSDKPPRPFRRGRDGMSLGEGAAVVALAKDEGEGERDRGERPARCFGYVAGFGASTDAVHITAPDRHGVGLARAATAALVESGCPGSAVELVSAHGTATPFNDAAEAQALRLALGDGASPVVHPFKAQIGHTLGAAGLLESLAVLGAMEHGVGPPAAGQGEIDPECDVTLLDRATARATNVALKLSAAFGGSNAALVLTRLPGKQAPRLPRPVFLRHVCSVTAALDAEALAARLADTPEARVGRFDELARLVITAVSELAAAVGIDALAGAGIVVGHALATLETNDAYDARRRERGARYVEPRRFPATSPNAAGGECAIAFKLTGPSLAVGGGLHGGVEALAVARDLVAAGDADRMVVVAADVVGPVSRALLAAAGWPDLAPGASAALITADANAGAGEQGPGSLVGPVETRLFGAQEGRSGEGPSGDGRPPPGVGWRELHTYLTRLPDSA